jgi:hypothetical protein
MRANVMFDWLRAGKQAFPNIAFNDKCVRSVLTYDYYGFSNSIKSFAVILLGILALIL